MRFGCFLAVIIWSVSASSWATTVGVYGGDTIFAADTLKSHYNAQPGVTAVSLATDFTGADIAGLDMVAVVVRTHAWTATSLTDLATYVATGGRLLILDEYVGFRANSAALMNEALTAVGATIRSDGVSNEPGFQVVAEIATDPLTDGVGVLHAGGVTGLVLGQGTALARSASDLILFAWESVGQGYVFAGADGSMIGYINEGGGPNDNDVFFTNLLTAGPGGGSAVPVPAGLALTGLFMLAISRRPPTLTADPAAALSVIGWRL